MNKQGLKRLIREVIDEEAIEKVEYAVLYRDAGNRGMNTSNNRARLCTKSELDNIIRDALPQISKIYKLTEIPIKSSNLN
jgi:hypothetical protein